MQNYDKMSKRIGNRFDLVLIASERARELRRERKLNEEQIRMYGSDIKREFAELRRGPNPSVQTLSEIEQGLVGREYLNKIKARTVKKKSKPVLDF